MKLDVSWIDKLRALPVYTPSAETLALRAAVPSPGDLPAMTVQELAEHNGQHEGKNVYTSVCGFIFEHKVCLDSSPRPARTSRLVWMFMTFDPPAGVFQKFSWARRNFSQRAPLAR
jgi:hypothetical protein